MCEREKETDNKMIKQQWIICDGKHWPHAARVPHFVLSKLFLLEKKLLCCFLFKKRSTLHRFQADKQTCGWNPWIIVLLFHIQFFFLVVVPVISSSVAQIHSRRLKTNILSKSTKTLKTESIEKDIVLLLLLLQNVKLLTVLVLIVTII